MHRALLSAAFVLVSCTALAAQSAPDLKSATVTIPYSELRALWEAAQAKPAPTPPEPPEPPVPFVITQARHAIEFGADLVSAEVVAKFEINVLSKHPTLVPLIGTEAALAELTAEGGSIIPAAGYHSLYATSAGKKTVALRYSLRARSGSSFEIPVTPAATGEVTFSGVPAGREVDLRRAFRQAGSGPLRFRLAAGDSLAFQLVSPQVVKPKTEPVPASWQVSTHAVASSGEGRLDVVAQLTATQTGGDVPALSFDLPAQASIRTLQSEHLERWEGVRSPDGRTRRVTVQFKRPEEARRIIALSYDLPPPALVGEWSVAVPLVVRAEQERRVAYLVTPDSIDLSAERALPEAVPPSALAGAVGGGRLLAVECEPGEMTARATGKARQLAATAAATIEDAQYQTRVVADGAGRTNARLTVRHERAESLRIQLPAEAVLLTCAVDGLAASPVQTGPGAFELLLSARPNKQSPVEFSYTHRHKEFGAVAGELALALPRIDLFTTLLAWEVALPSAYELSAAEGNVQFAPASAVAPEPGVVRLRKELTRGEAPAVALFYQKRTL